MLSNLSVAKCLVGSEAKIQNMAIGSDLLNALLYYLDNLWNPAEGEETSSIPEFQKG